MPAALHGHKCGLVHSALSDSPEIVATGGYNGAAHTTAGYIYSFKTMSWRSTGRVFVSF
jgi:hypothetical protein